MLRHRREQELQASANESDRRLRYGGPLFSAASALPLDRGLVRGRRLVPVIASALRRPRRGAALILLLLRTRSEYVCLSDSLVGQALRTFFEARALGVFPQNQLCRGVLVLPSDHADYARGRRRQALRTNLRRAASAGVTCEVVSDRSRLTDEVFEVMGAAGATPAEGEPERWRASLALPEMTLFAARGKDGRPLAIAGVFIDEAVAVVRFAIASDHEARWALHDHLVRLLIARRVAYLMAEGGGPFGALGFTGSLQHYQHLLGYELRHLRPHAPRRVRAAEQTALPSEVSAATASRQPVPVGSHAGES